MAVLLKKSTEQRHLSRILDAPEIPKSQLSKRGQAKKKADMAEHPKVFCHVGLLINGPPDPGLTQTGRVALYLVIRLTSTAFVGDLHVASTRTYYSKLKREMEGGRCFRSASGII